ncbi:hypothetical protein [Nocardioides sp.]|uniref:hypothetical protein n=1 Tax=Nocardioides sp. TaxID=35761 RepID=UPI002C883B01|nr:hypothetical protein [Nocardioides sp.]HXH80429.1 hypothetical protein [Nocardioides sp.]
MDTMQEKLDRSFGDGPALPPVGIHVTAGRRALIRRRVAGVTAGLAAVTVLIAGWYAVSPGSTTASDLRGGDPASTTSPADPSPSQDSAPAASEAPWPKASGPGPGPGVLIRYTDGELEVRPGVIVHEHIGNPYGLQPPEFSDALDVTWKGERHWLIIKKRRMPLGTLDLWSEPSDGWASFADYVASQVDPTAGIVSGWPETFRLDDEERVVPTPGTQVLNRTDDPQLGPTFASPGDITGAAVVSVAGKEGNYFVVWRVVDGTLDVITTPPGDIVGRTFEELLAWAQLKYASGEGLR